MEGPARDELRWIPAPLRRFVEQAPEMRPLTLAFRDRSREAAYQVAYFEANLPYIRLAHVLGVVLWVVFGGLAYVVVQEGRLWDMTLRFAIAIPATVASLWCTYAQSYRRWWRIDLLAILSLSAGVWIAQRALVVDARPDWGYAGLMLILAFTYVFSKLPFLDASIAGAVMIAAFNVVSRLFTDDDLLFSDYFLLSFAVAGMAAAYGLERSSRLLFLRERELDAERARADALLLNTMPRSVVVRLKERSDHPGASFLADDLPAVSVLFADLVGFTRRAGAMPPEELVTLLDDVFRRFDGLAAEIGLEKIKTIGDAYMAAAGAPVPRDDHASAAAEMALGILEVLDGATWPSGEAMQVRIGIASGPAVAGVIGRERFAYDLWGDTVNLASRLESNGEPGRVFVSDATEALLHDRYRFEPPRWLDLKGKGPTHAHPLIGRVEGGPPSDGPD